MAGSIVRRHLNKNFELVGVFSSAAAYLVFLNKQSAEEGMTYYDTTLNQLRTHDGTSFSPAGQNGVSAGSLDDAANIGTKITIDGALTSGVEIEATDAKISSDGTLLLLDNNDTGSDIHALEITSTSTAAAIKLNNTTATTDDIQGTGDVWAITGQGLATFDKGVEILGDTASATLKLGASSDITISYTDGGTPGTVGAGLMFKANTSADQIQIGDSTRAIDVWFEGSADTNYMLWDASANLLILNGSDIRLEDSDILSFGDSDDVTITWNQATPSLNIEALVQDTGQIRIGSTNAIDLAVYGNTATDIALFDVSTAVLEMNGWDMNLQDDDFLYFGDSNDVTIRWTAGQLDMLAAADDTVWTIGNGTNSFDIQIFGETSAADIVFDASANKLSLDGIDLKLEDDDYILLGDSATAAGSADGTIRWDSSAAVVEIVGNTTFEGAAIIVDNDLTVSGTLTLSGALNPSSLALGDGEAMTFGDGSDLTMSATGTTMTVAILSGSSLDITGSGGNAMTIGASGNLVNLTLSGTLAIGADNKGYDVSFFAENASDLVLWDQDAVSNVGAFKFTGSCAYFTDSSAVGDTAILLGTGASDNGDFAIRGTSGPALLINQVASGVGTMEIGASGKGITTTFHSETASAFMKWVQASDQLQLEGAGGTASLALGDGDQILFGDTLGTGDFVISSTSAVLTIGQVASGTGTIAMGVTDKGIDQKWWAETSGDFMLWDQDGHGNLGALQFEDSALEFVGAAATYTYAISTSAMLVTATDNSAAKVTWGDNGTNGLDQEWLSVSAGNLLNWDAGTETLKFTDCLCTMIGADSRGTILAITGNDTSGNSDTVTINHDGTAAGLKITCDGTTSVALELASAASQTTTLALIDGTTGNWIGANDVGMLQLTKDTALANAGGSMLLVTNSAQPVSAAEGFMARFVDTGTAQTNAFGVQISVTSTTGALNVASGTSTFADAVTCTAGVQSGGVARAANTTHGAGTSIIAPGTTVVDVTSSNADFIIVLPATVVGNIITLIVGTNGFELQTPAAGTPTINTVDCSAGNTNEAAIPADSISTLTAVAANEWSLVNHTVLGAHTGAITPNGV